MTGNEKKERLHVFMARCGVGSRRSCEQIIRQGRITLNGCVVTRMGIQVDAADTVALDGRELRPHGKNLYLALNKPVGYLCSNSDRFGRPLARDLLVDYATVRLFHVGRLDLMSSGIIFYTNDGDFAHLVTHPSFGITKEYRVETRRIIQEPDLESYRSGLSIEGQRFRCVRYRLSRPTVVYLVLEEGRNREIRRVFRHLGYTLKRIHRVRIGCVNVKGLANGEYRRLDRGEVEWFLRHRDRRPGREENSRAKTPPH